MNGRALGMRKLKQAAVVGLDHKEVAAGGVRDASIGYRPRRIMRGNRAETNGSSASKRQDPKLGLLIP